MVKQKDKAKKGIKILDEIVNTFLFAGDIVELTESD